jgi:hypothetical protein
MLTWNNVIKYIKQRLSFPTGFFELKDEELIEYLTENALTEFSNYFPNVNRVVIDTRDPNVKHPSLKNCYLIRDPDNLDIFDIKECYFPMNELAYTGHPLIPPSSLEGMKNWSIGVFTSRFLAPFSILSRTYKFITPNIIELTGETTPDYFVVEYERMQPPDLSGIPLIYQQEFKDFCLAHAKILLGERRSLYDNGKLTTPFGDIPIKGSELKEEGLSEREKLKNDFLEDARPSVDIDTY